MSCQLAWLGLARVLILDRQSEPCRAEFNAYLHFTTMLSNLSFNEYLTACFALSLRYTHLLHQKVFHVNARIPVIV